jgi:glycosyltransferase involved in cell wall biosynthesis
VEPVAVIPVFNHEHAIAATVAQVREQGLPCILVDDGSNAVCGAVLDGLVTTAQPSVSMVRLLTNQGKGGAVKAGLRAALREGYSHALQIDADGQHDPREIPKFLAASRAQPNAFVTGMPVYDDSVPKARLYGRLLTHVWVWINCLSMAIRDAMCGFRVYPLSETVALIDSAHIGNRMDFDPEIAVRLVWRGVEVVNLPTQVGYPKDGVSHFDLWRDNVRISAMHTRLFFGMLLRFPRLMWRKFVPE